MDEQAHDRTVLAVGRLERALSRIEKKLAERAATGPAEPVDEERHMMLKKELMQAIRTVDALIADREGR